MRERVYDTVTGQHLLIPQGARLLASYDSMVAWGQERVLLCWSRIIFPNGSSINLQCMPAADLKGQAGLTDEVDNHWDRLIAAVGLSTVLSLVVVPAFFLIMDDLSRLLGWIFGRFFGKKEEEQPALEDEEIARQLTENSRTISSLEERLQRLESDRAIPDAAPQKGRRNPAANDIASKPLAAE